MVRAQGNIGKPPQLSWVVPAEPSGRARQFRAQRSSVMNLGSKSVVAVLGLMLAGGTCLAQTLPTHRIPAALAMEAIGEAVSSCAKRGYRETAVLVDADGATIATLRGAGIHTLDSA